MTDTFSSMPALNPWAFNGPDPKGYVSKILTDACVVNAFDLVLTQLSVESGPRLPAEYLSSAEAATGPLVESAEMHKETPDTLSEAVNSDRMCHVFGIVLMADMARRGDEGRQEKILRAPPQNSENGTKLMFPVPRSHPRCDTLLVADGEKEGPATEPGAEAVITEKISSFHSVQPQIISANISLIEIETHLPPLIMQVSGENLLGNDDRTVSDALLKAPQVVSAPIRVLKLVLHPAELGALNVRIRMIGSGMQLEIMADTGAAAERLSQVREKLLEKLTAAGGEIREADLRIGVLSPRQANDHPQPVHNYGQNAFGAEAHKGAFSDRRPNQKNHEATDEKSSTPDPSEPLGAGHHDGMFV